MRIGLVDVDGHHFPNLALMKISASHKQQGDDVEWAIPLMEYEAVYRAKVFTFTPDDNTAWNTKFVISGGTGYGYGGAAEDYRPAETYGDTEYVYENYLPKEVEHLMPDYSLYGITDTAYGYLSRGCPRHCDFCIVDKKEGFISEKVANLSEWWSGQKNIKLLDPNLLACRDCLDLLGQLAESGAWVDYTQGLDIRSMTSEKAAAINKTKWKMLHFAWDNAGDANTERALKEWRGSFGDDDRKLTVYVLTNFNSTHEQDLYRIYRLREMGYMPYVMIYDKPNADRFYKDLQRWCNNRIIFHSCLKFEDYEPRRQYEKEIQRESDKRTCR